MVGDSDVKLRDSTIKPRDSIMAIEDSTVVLEDDILVGKYIDHIWKITQQQGRIVTT